MGIDFQPDDVAATKIDFQPEATKIDFQSFDSESPEQARQRRQSHVDRLKKEIAQNEVSSHPLESITDAWQKFSGGVSKAFGALSSSGPLTLDPLDVTPDQLAEETTRRFNRTPSQEMAEIKANPAYQAGEVAQNAIKMTPGERAGLGSQIGEQIGGALPMALGPLAAPAFALEAVGNEVSSGVDRIKKENPSISEDDAAQRAITGAFEKGFITAATFEILPKPIKKLLQNHVVEKFGEDGLSSWLGKRLAASTEAGTLMGAQEAANQLVEGKNPLSERTAEAATGGMAFGAVMPWQKPEYKAQQLREEGAPLSAEALKEIQSQFDAQDKLDIPLPEPREKPSVRPGTGKFSNIGTDKPPQLEKPITGSAGAPDAIPVVKESLTAEPATESTASVQEVKKQAEDKATLEQPAQNQTEVSANEQEQLAKAAGAKAETQTETTGIRPKHAGRTPEEAAPAGDGTGQGVNARTEPKGDTGERRKRDRFQMTKHGMVIDTLYSHTITHQATDPTTAREVLEALNKSDLNGKYVNGVALAQDASGTPILVSNGLPKDIKLSKPARHEPKGDTTTRTENGATENVAGKEGADSQERSDSGANAENGGTKADSNLASDWTGATEEIELNSGVPLPKFPDRKMTELDKATTSHSAKLQKSSDDARRAQREIDKVIPDKKRQMAASVYREAGGDMAKLQEWESRAKQKWMKDAAKDAQSLTPEEISIIGKVDSAFKTLEARGNKYGVLSGHRDNYVPHLWEVSKPGHAVFGSRLREKLKFNKARTLDTFFDGDQAGFKPKNMAIGDVLPAYLHEMNKVIADRQLVQDIVKGKAKDGRPLAVPRGIVQVIEGAGGDKEAVLVMPKAARELETRDYETIPNQPALSKWTWEGADTDGKPVFVKADLELHPEAARRVNAIVGKSPLREWYNKPREGTARILPAIVKGLDVAQSTMKREMFGLLPPFHQVQEGTHAIGHLVNPFYNIPKIDLRDAKQMDAARHGLMLTSDKTNPNQFIEGVGADSTLVSRGIRKLGAPGRAAADVIDGYQRFLFEHYIPGLKYKTYEAILGRNMGRYKTELTAGKITESDVKLLSAEQTNAAYGHLNYALLDRSPIMKDVARLALLAPDFLEARVRFFGQAFKGIGGSKVGQEQLKAIAVLALAQAGMSFTLAQLTGGEWDSKHPFEFRKDGRKYFMRSVPEDAQRALAFLAGDMNTAREFWAARVNPAIVKPAYEAYSGMNYRGEKIGLMDILTDAISNYIPITARSLPGVRSLTETSRNSPISPLEQLAGSLGLKISRYSPITNTYGIAQKWMDKNKIEKNKGSYPVSAYQQLRYALEDGDMERARAEYKKLLDKKGDAHKVSAGFRESVKHPFTQNDAMDSKMRKDLAPEDAEICDLAQKRRNDILNRFDQIGIWSVRMKAPAKPSIK